MNENARSLSFDNKDTYLCTLKLNERILFLYTRQYCHKEFSNFDDIWLRLPFWSEFCWHSWMIWCSSTLLIRIVKKGPWYFFFTILIMLKYESIFTSFNFWGKCNWRLNTYSGDPLFGSLQLSRYLSTIGNCDCQPSIAQWKWESILDILWYTARKRKNKTRYKKKIYTYALLCV